MKKTCFMAFATSISWSSIVFAQDYISWDLSNQSNNQVAQLETKAEGPHSVSIELESPYKLMRDGGQADFWTPDRYRNAKPIPLPKATETDAISEYMEFSDHAEQVSEPGRPPEIKVKRSKAKLFEPIIDQDSDHEIQMYNALEYDTYASGTAGAPFSSSRVTPAPTVQNSFPYRTTGKLFFKDSAGNSYHCTASVLRPRLIITAGHCVLDPVKKQWYTNFKFIPAYHNGSAPYGQWSATWVVTTSAWANNSTGKVPNQGDYALLEMQDNSLGQKIGTVTGYLGYRTYGLNNNHVSMFGYPASFDSGNIMHRVDSTSFKSTTYNTVEFPGDMTQGSSGGKFVENFGELSSGQYASPMNAVVGVLSYGIESQKIVGASILDSQFLNSSKTGILDIACAHKSGNC